MFFLCNYSGLWATMSKEVELTTRSFARAYAHH
jgi:hypothetical protein